MLRTAWIPFLGIALLLQPAQGQDETARLRALKELYIALDGPSWSTRWNVDDKVGALDPDSPNRIFSSINSLCEPGDPTLRLVQGGTIRCWPNDDLILEVLMPNNGLVGEFPDVCDIGMFKFDLNENALTGPVDRVLCPEMQIIQIRGNQFSGQFTSRLYNDVNLRLFDADNNNIEGGISSLGPLNWNLLVSFRVRGNRLTGPIPAVWTGQSVVYLDFAENDFSGPFPDFQMSTTVPYQLFVSDNPKIAGPFPPSVLQNSHLIALRMANLPLVTGSFPATIGSGSLQLLDIGNTGLTGPFSGLNALGFLRFALMSNTDVRELPTFASSTNSMVRIEASNANISGTMPPTYGSLVALQLLSLRDNPGLTGPVPTSLLDKTELLGVDLQNTGLSGSVSDWVISPSRRILEFLLSDSPGLSGAFEANSNIWHIGLTRFEVSNCPLLDVAVSIEAGLRLQSMERFRAGGIRSLSLSSRLVFASKMTVFVIYDMPIGFDDTQAATFWALYAAWTVLQHLDIRGTGLGVGEDINVLWKTPTHAHPVLNWVFASNTRFSPSVLDPLVVPFSTMRHFEMANASLSGTLSSMPVVDFLDVRGNNLTGWFPISTATHGNTTAFGGGNRFNCPVRALHAEDVDQMAAECLSVPLRVSSTVYTPGFIAPQGYFTLQVNLTLSAEQRFYTEHQIRVTFTKDFAVQGFPKPKILLSANMPQPSATLSGTFPDGTPYLLVKLSIPPEQGEFLSALTFTMSVGALRSVSATPGTRDGMFRIEFVDKLVGSPHPDKVVAFVDVSPPFLDGGPPPTPAPTPALTPAPTPAPTQPIPTLAQGVDPDAVSARISITIQDTYIADVHESEAFSKKARQGIAGSLGISTRRVEIIDVRSGSVIVTFRILSRNAEEKDLREPTVAASVNTLASLLGSPTSVWYDVDIFANTDSSKLDVVFTEDKGDSGGPPLLVILGATIGGLLVVVLMIYIVFVVRSSSSAHKAMMGSSVRDLELAGAVTPGASRSNLHGGRSPRSPRGGGSGVSASLLDTSGDTAGGGGGRRSLMPGPPGSRGGNAPISDDPSAAALVPQVGRLGPGGGTAGDLKPEREALVDKKKRDREDEDRAMQAMVTLDSLLATTKRQMGGDHLTLEERQAFEHVRESRDAAAFFDALNQTPRSKHVYLVGRFLVMPLKSQNHELLRSLLSMGLAGAPWQQRILDSLTASHKRLDRAGEDNLHNINMGLFCIVHQHIFLRTLGMSAVSETVAEALQQTLAHALARFDDQTATTVGMTILASFLQTVLSQCAGAGEGLPTDGDESQIWFRDLIDVMAVAELYVLGGPRAASAADLVRSGESRRVSRAKGITAHSRVGGLKGRRAILQMGEGFSPEAMRLWGSQTANLLVLTTQILSLVLRPDRPDLGPRITLKEKVRNLGLDTLRRQDQLKRLFKLTEPDPRFVTEVSKSMSQRYGRFGKDKYAAALGDMVDNQIKAAKNRLARDVMSDDERRLEKQLEDAKQTEDIDKMIELLSKKAEAKKRDEQAQQGQIDSIVDGVTKAKQVLASAKDAMKSPDLRKLKFAHSTLCEVQIELEKHLSLLDHLSFTNKPKVHNELQHLLTECNLILSELDGAVAALSRFHQFVGVEHDDLKDDDDDSPGKDQPDAAGSGAAAAAGGGAPAAGEGEGEPEYVGGHGGGGEGESGVIPGAAPLGADGIPLADGAAAAAVSSPPAAASASPESAASAEAPTPPSAPSRLAASGSPPRVTGAPSPKAAAGDSVTGAPRKSTSVRSRASTRSRARGRSRATGDAPAGASAGSSGGPGAPNDVPRSSSGLRRSSNKGQARRSRGDTLSSNRRAHQDREPGSPGST